MTVICMMRRRLTLASLVLLALSSAVSAQSQRPLDISSLGLKTPPGIVRQANGQRVLTNDEQGKPVVGMVHVFLGEYRIVLLPDGTLVSRSPSAAPVTERPFKPLTVDQVAKLLKTQFPNHRIRKTRHYVYVYNTSDVFALATSRILETMLPGVSNHSRAQRIKTHAPKVPLVAIMFRNDQQFQAYRRMPPGVVAYYHQLTNRIVMYEESKLAKVKAQLAIQQSINTIAHEGVHQILHNIGVQKRLSVWPMWLSEGMAEYYAPTSTGRRLRWKGAGQVNDLRMFELEQHLKSTEAKTPDGKLISDTVAARRLTSTGYAAAWSLTHYLAKQKKTAFNRYVNQLSNLQPLQGGRGATKDAIPANLTLFEEHFGKRYDEIEHDLIAHLRKLPYKDPFANWPHYLATVAVPNGRRALREAEVFHSPQRANQWVSDALQRIPAAQRRAARTNIRQFPNRGVAENAARVWLRTGR